MGIVPPVVMLSVTTPRSGAMRASSSYRGPPLFYAGRTDSGQGDRQSVWRKSVSDRMDANYHSRVVILINNQSDPSKMNMKVFFLSKLILHVDKVQALQLSYNYSYLVSEKVLIV